MTASRVGLFLDLDGTLADSLLVMRAVYERFLGHFGKTGSAREFSRLNGPPLAVVVAELAKVHGLTEPLSSLLSTYQGMIEDAYLDVAANPGAADLLKAARHLGMQIGVVTSNSSSLAWTWLQGVNLEAMVDVVVGGEDVKAGKPDPEPYLLALQRTACEAAKSYAVEDSIIGARAATAAKIKTFFLSNSVEKIASGNIAVADLDDVTKFLVSEQQMTEINIFPLAALHELKIARPFEQPAAVEARVAEIWQQEKKKHGERLTNGKIYSLVEHRADFLLIEPSEYRYVLARRRAPALVDAGLRIKPLGVTGILLCADGLVLGRRSDKVATDSGLWELAPSGGLAQPDPRTQILEELEEELGLEQSRVDRLEACGLVEDTQSDVFDIIFRLQTAATGKDIEDAYTATASNEYAELAIIKPANVQAFLNSHDDHLLPALRPLLDFVGLV